MTATTLDYAAAARASLATREAPKTGFWKRVFDALIEARMRQAKAQVDRFTYMLPATTEQDRKA